jgi:hypothetical protein
MGILLGVIVPGMMAVFDALGWSAHAVPDPMTDGVLGKGPADAVKAVVLACNATNLLPGATPLAVANAAVFTIQQKTGMTDSDGVWGHALLAAAEAAHARGGNMANAVVARAIGSQMPADSSDPLWQHVPLFPPGFMPQNEWESFITPICQADIEQQLNGRPLKLTSAVMTALVKFWNDSHEPTKTIAVKYAPGSGWDAYDGTPFGMWLFAHQDWSATINIGPYITPLFGQNPAPAAPPHVVNPGAWGAFGGVHGEQPTAYDRMMRTQRRDENDKEA